MSKRYSGLRQRMGATTLAMLMLSTLMPVVRATESAAGGEELFEEEESTAIVPTAPLPSCDPFFSLITPREERESTICVLVAPKKKETVEPAPLPVQYSVLAIAGEEEDHTAVIVYKNETYVVQPGAKIPDDRNTEFEIKDVTSDKVTAWDPKVKRIVPVRLPQLAEAVPGAGP